MRSDGMGAERERRNAGCVKEWKRKPDGVKVEAGTFSGTKERRKNRHGRVNTE